MEASKNEYTEGQATKTIENQTAKLPSNIYLGAAIAAMGASLVFKLTAKRHASLFFGQWVAPLLLFGIYNKIVKTQGSEQ